LTIIDVITEIVIVFNTITISVIASIINLTSNTNAGGTVRPTTTATPVATGDNNNNKTSGLASLLGRLNIGQPKGKMIIMIIMILIMNNYKNNNSHRNLDSTNNFISILMGGLNPNSDDSSSN